MEISQTTEGKSSTSINNANDWINYAIFPFVNAAEDRGLLKTPKEFSIEPQPTADEMVT